MEQRNEPTTAEIVAFLERLQTAIGSNRHSELWHYEQIISNARSRLEQLERENAALRESNGRFAQAVSELTMQAGAAITRAEKAEAERDAAVADLGIGIVQKCVTCERGKNVSKFYQWECAECRLSGAHVHTSNWRWRGLRGKGNA